MYSINANMRTEYCISWEEQIVENFLSTFWISPAQLVGASEDEAALNPWNR